MTSFTTWMNKVMTVFTKEVSKPNGLVGPTMERVVTIRDKEIRKKAGKGSIRFSRVFTPRLDENGNPLPKSERRPKKKVACMIGYCGTGYHGMQVNPGAKTIEGDLFAAFVKAGAISKDNSDDMKKNAFMRAARTDKGVHAAGNVVSLKLIIEDEDIVEKINAELPEQIRVWGIRRTNKSFDCRRMCSSRIYEYLIPTYSFLPPKPTSRLGVKIKEANELKPGVARDDKEGLEWWANVTKKLHENGITDSEIQKAQDALQDKQVDETGQFTDEARLIKKIKGIETSERRAYRMSTERLQLVRDAMAIYKGHHNFHNFTLGKSFKDPSAGRFMKSLEVSEPFVIEGTEWCSIKIHGQSFMLHQIRKMIAMATLVVRTGCPLDRIDQAFTEMKINIPKAPALGLLLENPVYDGVNERLVTIGYTPLDFTQYSKEMDAFKMKFIYDKIYTEEVKENVYYGFFSYIDSFNGEPIFDFLTATYDKDVKPVSRKEIIIPNEKEEASIEE